MSLILDGTNGVSDIDGTAATPAIRGTDTNTGIFFPAADTIAFSEGGAEAMRIDSSGQVGIGTTSPNSVLTSQTSTTSTSVFSFASQLNNSYSSNDSIVALGFHNRADANSSGVGAAIALSGGGVSAGSGNMIFCIKGTGNIATAVAPSDEKMRITSAGVVQVGNNAGTGEVFAQNTVKVWGAIQSNGTLYNSFGVSSASKNSTGNFTINFTRTLSSARFGMAGSTYAGASIIAGGNESTTSTGLFSYNTSGAANDVDIQFLIAGGS